MASAKKAKSGFPFPYIGEGIAAARKAMFVLVGFSKAAKKKDAIVKLPRPFTHVTWHTPTLLEVAHVGELQWAVAREYPERGPRAEEGEATVEQWTAFNRAIDRWLTDLHAVQPVAFAIKPADDEYGTSFGAWHAWSSLEAGPQGLWSTIEASLVKSNLPARDRKRMRGVIEWVVDRWRDDLAVLSPKEQDKRLAELDVGARAFLDGHGGVPEVVQPADASKRSVEEQLAVWQSIRGKNGDREERFRQAMNVPIDDIEPSLYGLVHDLVYDQRYEKAAGICVDALRGPVEYPDQWTDLAILALVRAKRFEEARALLPMALFQSSLYSAVHLMVGFIELLEHEKRDEDARAIFHSAAKLVVYFATSARGVRLERERFGKSRAAYQRRATELWREVVEPDLDVATLSDAVLAGAARNLRKVGCIELAERCEREEERRRIELFGPERQDTIDIERVPLLAKAPQKATDEDVAEALALLPTLDEAMPLLDWAYKASERRAERTNAVYTALAKMPPPSNRRRRLSWLTSLNNAAVMTWKQKDLALSRALVEAARPFAHENPAIFHAAACTYVSLGDLDKAFEQVTLAVEHRYENLGRMKRDPNLASLREWQKFKELFANRTV